MKRLLAALLVFLLLIVIASPLSAQPEPESGKLSKEVSNMKIQLVANAKTVIFELNSSQAAKALYAQLPLSLKLEDYSDNEKIFYPPKRLSTANTPLALGGPGTLAYYAPWGDVVLFYGDYKPATGLYELGKLISGLELIAKMHGTVHITGLSQ